MSRFKLGFLLGAIGLATASGLVHAQSCGSVNWSHLMPTDSPSVRVDPAMTYDAARDRIVLFGGFALTAFSNETWEYDNTNATWILQHPAHAPSARSGAAMVYDSQRQRVMLFGGAGGSFQNDTWEWDGNDWIQISGTPAPRFREYHAMAYDPGRAKVLLYGGYSLGPATLQDTWEYDPATGTWQNRAPVVIPGPRQKHAMAYDDVTQSVILYGGVGATGTFRYDPALNNWFAIATGSSPGQRYSMQLAEDPVRHRVILFGGTSTGSDYFADTWEWNGATQNWGQLTPAASPSARTSYGLAFDPPRGRAMLFGGFASGIYQNDTWAYIVGRTPVVTSQPATQTVYAGQTAVLSVQASGPGLTYQWLKDTLPLFPGAGRSGVASPTLIISSAHASDAGSYQVIVRNACGTVSSNAARLNVTCYANCDGSTTTPVLNVNDFICFQSRFAAGCP